MSRRYWKSIEERDGGEDWLPADRDEFPEPLAVLPDAPGTLGRRGFLKAAGFGLAGTLAAGCQRGPVSKAIPFLNQPEEVMPGRATWYATTCGACSAACGLLVKNRDGRPIKLEGNPQHPLSRGGLCAVGQASLLGLYDRWRHRGPLKRGQPASWADVDADIVSALAAIRHRGGALRLLTGTIVSPTLSATIGRFMATFPNARHVVYDAISSSAILDAHERTHGRRALPRYHFGQAAVIAGVDADFLGTWISPVEFTRGYRDGRSLEGNPPRCSYHAQFESGLTITGTKADWRTRIAPGEEGPVLTQLAARVARRAGLAWPAGDVGMPPVPGAPLDDLAGRLWAARGASLVVSGCQDVAVQVICNFVNHLLGNYGRTIDINRPSYQRGGCDAALGELAAELAAGAVDGLLVAAANPAYDLPADLDFATLARRVDLLVSFAGSPDETAALAGYVCPDHHYLEAWSDAEPAAGCASITQPVLAPIGGTRAIVESLARWMDDARPAYELVRAHWESALFPRRIPVEPFETFWDTAVHDGAVELQVAPRESAASGTSAPLPDPVAAGAAPPEGALSLVLYPSVGQLDGRHAHNPWLQELPDPITKVTWDNCASLSPDAAASLGVREGDVVRIETGGPSPAAAALELPVYIQPGQHDRAVAIPLGYGRASTERFTRAGPHWLESQPGVGPNGLVGINAAPLIVFEGGTLRYGGRAVRIAPTGRRIELATTQRHHSIIEPRQVSSAGSRPIVREMPVSALSAQQPPPGATREGRGLWPDDHPYSGRRWGLIIDLNACTGCSACVVACQVENNIPVVGRDEVRRQREMHWLRIDRYFTDADESVDVVHQPMLCQHCANAPCETVCPVLATVHSADGLNQQVYNRCVGTRYCANNCPYKVRRFNWFTYARADAVENLVLNPDVTVRTRGVMEKCSLCAQRLLEARISARARGEPARDTDVRTACEQSCPAGAIVLGDLNDPASRVAALAKDPRYFQVLEDLNVRPGVGYLAVVRNRDADPGKAGHV
ncbi:MAG: TAT-variant-translocated molybdopterin oxidoreductase [Acidobacteriota bacterium]